MAIVKKEFEHFIEGIGEVYVIAEIVMDFDGHDGIGSYEYSGSVGYDRGRPIWEPNYEDSVITVEGWDDEKSLPFEIKLTDSQMEDLFAHICDNIDSGDISTDDDDPY